MDTFIRTKQHKKRKCRSGKCDTGKIAGVENAGESPMDSQPENKLKER